MRRSRLSVRFAVALVGASLLGGGAVAAAPTTAPGRASVGPTVQGLPSGGPPVLYAAVPSVPVLQNRDPRFRAPYELVSGSERYVDGEYHYTDYIYDDSDTTYPADFARYGSNAADLMEYRMSVRGGDLAVRFSFTTLLAKDSTIAVVAFDSDRNRMTGSSTLPRDPGMSFPGTDVVLTTWGTGAEWSAWAGTAWRTIKLASRVDLEANQVTVTVPERVARPTGTWAATVATGLYDRGTGGWMALGNPVVGPNIVNLGFRFDERLSGLPPGYGQKVALVQRSPTTYQHDLDFTQLRSRGTRDNVPTRGLLYRIYASRLPSVSYVLERTPGQFQTYRASEGRQGAAYGTNYLSPLQPYSLYIPTSYKPSRPTVLTLSLHGQDGDYTSDAKGYSTLELGEARGSIILGLAGRGFRGWTTNEAEVDLFEAWNDVARHYTLDSLRTSLTGYSMGGYGSYRVGLRYPHLFSGLYVLAPGLQGALRAGGLRTVQWVPGVYEDATAVNQWVANARYLPVFHLMDSASESVFPPAQIQHVVGRPLNGSESLDSLGYRYRFWAMGADHILIANRGSNPVSTTFLGRRTIEQEPFHVTYTRVPESDRPDLGLVPDSAYWVSGIALRDAKTRGPQYVPGGPRRAPSGQVDLVSLGFGKSDPTSSVTNGAGVTAGGLSYVSQERTWSAPGKVAKQNRIVGKVTNVRRLTIDPVAARVDCSVRLDITSDGPLEVRLLGCPQPRSARSSSLSTVAAADTSLPATGSASLPTLAGLVPLRLRAGSAPSR